MKGDGTGDISEVNSQRNLHNLVFLRLCRKIGNWRQFSMIKIATLDSEYDEFFPEIVFDS